MTDGGVSARNKPGRRLTSTVVVAGAVRDVWIKARHGVKDKDRGEEEMDGETDC